MKRKEKISRVEKVESLLGIGCDSPSKQSVDNTDDNMDGRKKKIQIQTQTPEGMQKLPPDLEFELCARLPLEKLFQFRCVSKGWRSIILQPGFAEAYRRHYPTSCCLILSLSDDGGCDYLSAGCRFYYCPLQVDDGRSPDQFYDLFNVKFKDYQGVTQVVNGLVCCYYTSGVRVRNVWTGECIKLPDPNPNGFDQTTTSSISFASDTKFYFGFDPVNGVYKLLKISAIRRFTTGKPGNYLRNSDHINVIICTEGEILTLGDCSWRKLDGPPPVFFETESFLVDGVLYWIHNHKTLISFSLRDEKFRFIKPPHLDDDLVAGSWLTQFRGKLALYVKHTCQSLSIYSLKDDIGDSWSHCSPNLPRELHPPSRKRYAVTPLVPVGNLQSGEMLLSIVSTRESVLTLYSFEYEKRMMKRIFVGKLPQPWIDDERRQPALVSSCMVNLATIEAMIRSGGGLR